MRKRQVDMRKSVCKSMRKKKKSLSAEKSRKTLVIPKIFSIFVVQKKSITDGKVSNKI